MVTIKRLLTLAGGVMIAGLAGLTSAQAYPERPIRRDVRCGVQKSKVMCLEYRR